MGVAEKYCGEYHVVDIGAKEFYELFNKQWVFAPVRSGDYIGENGLYPLSVVLFLRQFRPVRIWWKEEEHGVCNYKVVCSYKVELVRWGRNDNAGIELWTSPWRDEKGLIVQLNHRLLGYSHMLPHILEREKVDKYVTWLERMSPRYGIGPSGI